MLLPGAEELWQAWPRVEARCVRGCPLGDERLSLLRGAGIS